MTTKKPQEVLQFQEIAKVNEILEAYQDHLIIINFYTNSCPICRSFKPSFFAVQKEFLKEKVLFAQINANQMPSIAQQFNIRGVPHTIFVKKGEIVHQASGGFPKPQFRRMVNDVLKQFFHVKTTSSQAEDMMFM